MQLKFFRIPAHDAGGFAEELNAFLRGHRILNVERELVSEPTLGFETESRWDSWRACPKGAMSQSPGLGRLRPYPGNTAPHVEQPRRGWVRNASPIALSPTRSNHSIRHVRPPCL